MVQKARINNAFYEELGEDWHNSFDHPVALLRAENALRNPWIASVLEKQQRAFQTFLDIGCGAGFLTNELALRGHQVFGIDLSPSSLEVAQSRDLTKSVEYQQASAYSLPFPDQSFDAVAAMDLLEHVEDPERVIQEASRVLKPGGLFFFHTFNRNLWSYLLVIKGVEWCLKKAPKEMHVYHLFLKPKEVTAFCKRHQLQVKEIRGVAPVLCSPSFFKLLLKGEIDSTFRFTFTSILSSGYTGYSLKRKE